MRLMHPFPRLNTINLYGLMLHRPEQLLGPYGEEIMSALLSLKKSGTVQKIGISVYSPDEFTELFSEYDFDIVQCPFNLIDRRLVNSGWLAKLKALGVEVHVRSSFLQGLLLMGLVMKFLISLAHGILFGMIGMNGL